MVEFGQVDIANPEHLEPMQQPAKKPSKEKQRNSMWFIAVFLVGIFTILFFLVQASQDPSKDIRTLDDLFLAVEEGIVDEDRGYMHNGYVYVKDDQGTWVTRVQIEDKLIQIPLHFAPRDLQKVDDIGLLNSTFAQKEIYIHLIQIHRNCNILHLAQLK